jgi:hypothetical protein
MLKESKGSINIGNKKQVIANDDGFSRGTLIGRILFDEMFGGEFSGDYGSLKKSLLVFITHLGCFEFSVLILAL